MIDMKTLGSVLVLVIAVAIVVQGFRVTSNKSKKEDTPAKKEDTSAKKEG